MTPPKKDSREGILGSKINKIACTYNQFSGTLLAYLRMEVYCVTISRQFFFLSTSNCKHTVSSSILF